MGGRFVGEGLVGGAGVGGMDIMSVCRYRSQYAESSSAAAASSRILLASSLSIPPFSPCLSSRTFRTRLASTPPMLLVVAEMARAVARTVAEILMVTSSCRRTYV